MAEPRVKFREGLLRLHHFEPDLVAFDRELAPWYMREIRAGRLHCLCAYVEERHVGWIVTRIEEDGGRRCFVIVLALGTSAEFDLTRLIYPALEIRAKALSCKLVRLHTFRLGLVAKMREQGFMAAEWVMRKELAA